MTKLKDVIGHEQNIQMLMRSITADRVAHAYLFVGPEGVGKSTIAQAFAQALLCNQPIEGDACTICRHCRQVEGGNHPDYHQVSPMGVNIKIEQIQQLQKTVQYRSYQGGRQIYLLNQCDKMTDDAANCLLKTLEEPPPGAVFILVSSRPYRILPTIQSRCQSCWFQTMTFSQVVIGLEKVAGITGEKAQRLAAMAGGSLGKALEMADVDFNQIKEEVLDVLDKIRGANVLALLKKSVAFSKERSQCEKWLRMLQLWLRDCLIWEQTQDQTLLIHINQLEAIKTESQRYGFNNLVNMMEEIEKACNRLNNMGNSRLVLDALFLSLIEMQASEGGVKA